VLFGILTICSSHSTQFDRDEISLLEEISKNIAFALNSIELKENYKQREMELIQSQKMAAVGVLSSGIAHEINNPLSAIIGEVQWLIEKQKNKKLLKSLKLLQKLCLKIAAIVQKLLIFSSQKTDSRNKKFNINDIINETISLVEKKLKLHNIKLTKHLDKTAPLLSINRNEMGQVIMNILFNSIDAMNNMAGSLTISTEFDNTKKYVLIKFEDTGTGISEENLPKIFDPFFTTKPVGKGTGLGLSISYKIIENAGGSLEIESKGTNMGTAAIIKLPV
jgi:C4-dicarboxylate-specific signal transduction histidine kinase